MRELPILFSAEMVRALLAGTKSQTRRIIKPQPSLVSGAWHWAHKSYDNGDGVHYFHTDLDSAKRLLLTAGCAPKPGDLRWVKETWRAHLCAGRESELIHYRADGESCPNDGERIAPWKPSIFMPRWASRLTLQITHVRVERIQDISPADCRAEGMSEDFNDIGARYCFGQLWNSINEKRGFGWDANPFVWCLSFSQKP